MNDLEILREAWSAPDDPSPAARATARANLLARAAGRRRRRRAMLVRLAAAGACAVAVAAGATLVVNVGGIREDAGVPIAAADVLERAAVAAEQQPFTPPRDDQWIYTEDRITGYFRGGPKTLSSWRRADGGGYARIENGKLRVEEHEVPPAREQPAPSWSGDYRSLTALPTDPDALLRWAYEQAEHITGMGLTDHGDVYQIFNGMLRQAPLPPDLHAAVYRALAQVPNVTLETVDVSGRPALALVQAEGRLREEVLLDPETYAYRGEGHTVIRDGDATGEAKRGDHVTAERVATAIVDEPGERP